MDTLQLDYKAPKPKILVISDSLGTTASAVVDAAAAQFDDDAIDVVRLTHVKNIDEVEKFLNEQKEGDRPIAVFHTLGTAALRREVRDACNQRDIPSIDLMGPAITVISGLTDQEPSEQIGALRNKQ
ncbi:MAG: hypothetical protein DUD39_01550 [Coriobacteriaceae bacterium]|jgi:regulator of PEP synthase PpsR (kinase-PPPase family)|uniref:kinase/pyrophosphorylase n=1 Tax=Atopobium sp. oral taxon 416 TaxID=712157 RepID=UPI000FF281A4|nr:kinase/pyrophosphorylase [Atopobium sp. oral taxon 416]QUC02273.1 kinase/pyrophosphorylase [Atopobium sp. oral taxon 416]RRF99992.1 MAG: hypothetical protein DUD39_01550 [Coriobacteriaceae bacterium]